MKHAAVTAAAALLLTACGAGAAGDGAASGAGGAAELTGAFEGVFHFEAQCFYLATADTRYSLSVPDGYAIEPEGEWDPSSAEEAQPVLHGPDGAVVANDGDTITVTGTVEALAPGGPCGTTEIVRADTVTTQ